jgi:hypothetical protein
MNSARIALAVLVSFSAILLGAPLAYAHVTGSSWETPVGKYTSDVGYDPVTFVAGQYTRFDFNLWIGKTSTDSNGITSGTPQSFAQVWIRILNKNTQDTLLATGIWSQPIGPTTLLYDFEEPGNYTLEVSYRDAQGNDIAVVSIPISVGSAGGLPPFLVEYVAPALLFIIGLAIGIVSMRFWVRRKERT